MTAVAGHETVIAASASGSMRPRTSMSPVSASGSVLSPDTSERSAASCSAASAPSSAASPPERFTAAADQRQHLQDRVMDPARDPLALGDRGLLARRDVGRGLGPAS